MHDDNSVSRPVGPDAHARLGFGPAREPPTVAVRSCAELKLWLKFAAPDEERRYASGPAIAKDQTCSAMLREYVLRLAELGFITPHRMRDSSGAAVYIVKRTRRPIVEGQL